jgi:hypothetical protein
MTLYTFLTVFFVLWAIAVLVMNWRQQRKFEESQGEIRRLNEEVERLRGEIRERQEPPKGFEKLRLVSGDEDEDGLN